jgi:hypothetical protein
MKQYNDGRAKSVLIGGVMAVVNESLELGM